MLQKAVILESPLEFALVGPHKSRDRVLVRSKNAGLDLIGLAAEAGDPFERPWPSSDIPFSLWSNRQLNIVKTAPVRDVGHETDSRLSKFRFVWNGLASKSAIEAVEKVLNLNLVELHRAVTMEDAEDIEMALAPVIYRCARANEQRLRSRRLLIVLLLVYGLVLAFAGVVAALLPILGKRGL
jgi:hypothetical protein